MSPRGLPKRAVRRHATRLGAFLAATLALPLGASDDVEALLGARRFNEAAAVAERAVAADPRDAAAAVALGRARIGQTRYEDAEEVLRRATELAPNDAEAFRQLGIACGRAAQRASLLRRAGLAADSRRAFERAVELDPRSLKAREALMQFYLQAPGFLGGSAEKAEEQGRAMLAIDPVAGNVALGDVRADRGQPAEAERHYRAALAAAPGATKARVGLAVLLQDASRFDEAFALLRAAPTPPPVAVLYQIGRAAALSGRELDAGRAALVTFLASPPDPEAPGFGAAQWRLGMILEQLGETENARRAYAEAARLDPSLDEPTKALRRLGK